MKHFPDFFLNILLFNISILFSLLPFCCPLTNNTFKIFVTVSTLLPLRLRSSSPAPTGVSLRPSLSAGQDLSGRERVD